MVLWGPQLHDSCCTVLFFSLAGREPWRFSQLPYQSLHSTLGSPEAAILWASGVYFLCPLFSSQPWTLCNSQWTSVTYSSCFPLSFLLIIFCYRHLAVSADLNSSLRSQLSTTLCLPKPFEHSQERHFRQQGSSL